MNFQNLPIDVQMQCCVFIEPDTFHTFSSMKDFQYLCSRYPYSERIYKERCEEHFAEYIDLRVTSNWKNFYNKVYTILDVYHVRHFRHILRARGDVEANIILNRLTDMNENVVIDAAIHGHLLLLVYYYEHHPKLFNMDELISICTPPVVEWLKNLSKENTPL